jgi:DNA-binding SARP family transcriptional activator/predicted ATPase
MVSSSEQSQLVGILAQERPQNVRMAKQTLQLLGPIQVTWHQGAPPRFRSPRAQALLAYLVVERRPIARDRLARLFWPDEAPAAGRAALRRELHNLANILPGCWQVDRQTAQFDPAGDTAVDLDELRRLAGEARWPQAAELVRGEFLEGLALDDNLEFESWLLAEREWWRQEAEKVLVEAASASRRQGELDQAGALLARLLKMVPWHEDGRRQLMALLARRGRFSDALRQYEMCRAVLAAELAVPPSAATTALYHRIRAAMARPAHNLPPQATPFIGREAEVAALAQRLAGLDCRLLTISGLGGIGKTRLGLEIARRMTAGGQRPFLHGVVYIPLAGLDAGDSQGLLAALAGALGLAYSGREPPERQLADYLAELELLLVLDNYDQLLPDTAVPAEILRRAVGVKLLVTSRERLNLREEWLYELDGLPYPASESPPAEDAADAAAIAGEYSAVRLLLESADRRHRPAAPGQMQDQMPAVLAITRLVQGLPLGLELAAARMGSLTAAEVLAELQQDIDALVTETRNMSPRHASLRAAFDVSWTALTAGEKRVLAGLSLFRGGYLREAGRQVTGASDADLASLTDKSLSRRMPSGRYEMHELMRQYAAEKLQADAGRAAAITEAHAAYYGRLLAEHEQPLLETSQTAALDVLLLEIDNIRPAWRWLAENRRLDLLDAAAWPLAMFFVLRGRVVEGLAMVEAGGLGRELAAEAARLPVAYGFLLHYAGRLAEAHDVLQAWLARPEDGKLSHDRGWALFLLAQTLGELKQPGAQEGMAEALVAAEAGGPRWLEGFIAARLADYVGVAEDEASLAAGEALAERARRIGRQLDHPLVLFNAHLSAARLATYRRDNAGARLAYEQALDTAGRLASPAFVSLTLMGLGHVTYLEEAFDQAREYCFESRLHARRIGSRRWEAAILNYLGDIARAEADFDQAADYYREGLAMCAAHGYDSFGWIMAASLSRVLLAQGRLDEAAGYLRSCLAGLAGGTNRVAAAMGLVGAAGLLLAWDRPAPAGELLRTAAAGLPRGPGGLEPADRREWQEIVTAAEGGSEVLRPAGPILSQEEAVALALSALNKPDG